jgi:Spy/CpxP family protein refolding chaperone
VHREVFAVLTPEQQAKAKALREEAQKRAEQRRQRRMNRPGAGL